YRFRLAYAMASRQRELPVGSAHPPAAHAAGSPDAGSPDAGSPGPFVLADEFTATLDRPLAKVVAFNLRKLVSRTGVGVLAATTHDDVADDLNPDLWVKCAGDSAIMVERWDAKKKMCRSRTTCGCRMAPDPTGRTSRGGITGATTSPT